MSDSGKIEANEYLWVLSPTSAALAAPLRQSSTLWWVEMVVFCVLWVSSGAEYLCRRASSHAGINDYLRIVS